MTTSDPGNGTRATLALVDAKVDAARAEMGGLHELIRSEFKATQRQLDDLKNLPVAVSSLTERVLHAEARITQVEKENDARQGWRKVTLPQILVGLAGLAFMAANTVVVLLNVS